MKKQVTVISEAHTGYLMGKTRLNLMRFPGKTKPNRLPTFLPSFTLSKIWEEAIAPARVVQLQ
jgi:hypothetical protein